MNPPDDTGGDTRDQKPDFGPRGYVPPQAAKRARKIVLREPMGLGWPIAAVVAGTILAGLGLVYFLTQAGPPGAPYERVANILTIDPRGAAVMPASTGQVLVVRAGGGVRSYLAPSNAITYCPESKALESADTVWSLEGRKLGGSGASLRPLPSRVHDGSLYVNLQQPGQALAPAAGQQLPVCSN